jgi:hypothetical protein
MRDIQTETDMKLYLGRKFHLDEAAASSLIQRVQSIGQDQQGIKIDPFAWLDQV